MILFAKRDVDSLNEYSNMHSVGCTVPRHTISTFMIDAFIFATAGL